MADRPEGGGEGARLAEIRVHPLKGARGISVERWAVDDFGPALDRRWMAVDAEGTFLTQRSHPRLVLVETAVEGGRLVLSAAGRSGVEVPGPEAVGPRSSVQVWRSGTEGIDVGEEPAAWLSDFLGEGVRILFMPDQVWRPVSRRYARDRRVSFADGFPFLLVSRASLDELNRRLDEPVPVERFRPNLVVEGTAAHEEDRWRRLRIGDVDLRVAKPCARCVVTTVDVDTGEKGSEPLRTLARYRRSDGKTYFGQNLIHEGRGTLEVGQDVAISRVGPPRPRLS